MLACRASGFLACFGLVCVLGCGSSSSDGAQNGRRDAVPVGVATVSVRDVPVDIRAIGTVSAYSTVALRSQVDGQLAEVHFREGQEVARGDLLFVLDQRPFQAALREAEAKLTRDRATATQAESEAGRFERLHKDGIVSADEFEQARTRAESAKATAVADEAAVETARIQLQYCTIYAPLGGRVGALLVHEGNVVKARDTTLAVINQIRPAYVEFAVPHKELPRIRERMAAGPMAVEATVTGHDEPASGTLSFVDNAVDTTTGTVRLKAEFPNEHEVLWPGAFVNVALHVTTMTGALVVPARAVQAGQGGRYAYVVTADGTVQPRTVELGPAVGDDVVIASGLAAGEQVVTDGQLRLAPGSHVVTDEAAAAPKGEPS